MHPQLLVICHRCPNATPPRPWNGVVVCCGLDGRSIQEHAAEQRCGLGHFGDNPLPDPPDPTACVHRGAQTGEAPCPTCAGNVRVKVFACARHGSCAIGSAPEGLSSCSDCAERRAPDE